MLKHTVAKLLIEAIKVYLGYTVEPEELNLTYNANSIHKQRGQFQTAFLKYKLNNQNEETNFINTVLSIDKQDIIELCWFANGFININIKDAYLSMTCMQYNPSIFATVNTIDTRKVIFDFGGLNLCKEPHVGHLRSLFIGECLQRVYKYCGYHTISDMHYGDLGTVIGLILAQIQRTSAAVKDIMHLTQIYKEAVSQHKSGDEELYQTAKTITYQLQNDQASPELKQLWQQIIQISKDHNLTILNKIGIKFDLFQGESDAIPTCKHIINNMLTNRNFYYDNGALVTRLADNKVFIVQKSDQAFLYSTTDVATVQNRVSAYGEDQIAKIIYIVDIRQRDHFFGMATCCERLNIINSNKIVFLGFGMVTDNRGNILKTRAGESISFNTALNLLKQQMIAHYQEQIEDKEIINNLRFDMLNVRSTSNYIFDINKLTNREGKTGSYVQYTLLRIKSLLKNMGFKKNNNTTLVIFHPQMRQLVLHILLFNEVIRNCLDSLETHVLVNYLYQIAHLTNNFYEEIRLSSLEQARQNHVLTLYHQIFNVMQVATDLLGI